MSRDQATFKWQDRTLLAVEPVGDPFPRKYGSGTWWLLPGVFTLNADGSKGSMAAFREPKGAARVRARARDALADARTREAGAQAQADMAQGRGGVSAPQEASDYGRNRDPRIPKKRREEIVEQLRAVGVRAGLGPFEGLTRQQGIGRVRVRAASPEAESVAAATAEEAAVAAAVEAAAATADLPPEVAGEVIASQVQDTYDQTYQEVIGQLTQEELDPLIQRAIALDPTGQVLQLLYDFALEVND